MDIDFKEHWKSFMSLLLIGLLMMYLICQDSLAIPRSWAETRPQKQVLVLHSGNSFTPAMIVMDDVYAKKFRESSDFNIVIWSEYLDATFTSKETHEAVLDLLKMKYGKMKLDLVIASEERDLQFAMEHKEELFPNVPIIFNSVTEGNLDIGKFNEPTTGSLRTIDFVSSVNNMIALQPDLESLVVVTGSGKTDRPYMDLAQKGLKSFNRQLKIQYTVNMSYSEIKNYVSKLPPKTAVLYVAIYTDSLGVAYNPRDAAAEICQLSNVPVYGVIDTHLEAGIVGGNLISARDVSENSAMIAMDVLRGKSVEDIPAKVFQNRNYFNWEALKRWRLDPNALPKDSVVLGKPVTLWDAYRTEIIIFVSLLVVLMVVIFMLLLLNISRRKNELNVMRLNAKLTESEQKIRAIYDMSMGYIGLLSVEGILLEVNQTALDSASVSAADVIGKPFWEGPWWKDMTDVQAFLQEAVQQAVQGRIINQEIKLVTKKGFWQYIIFTLKPVNDENGKVIFLIPEARDITPLKLIEQDLLNLNNALEEKVSKRTEALESLNIALQEEIDSRRIIEQQLQKAKEHAEAATEAKSMFLANMSHEIRTPLNAIIGYCNLLDETNLDEKQSDFLTRLYNSSKILLSLINDILDFSKIEANQIELEKMPFNIKRTFDEIDSFIRVAATNKGLSLDMTCDGCTDTWVLGDSVRLSQVLINLMNNAVKFTEQGVVSLRTSILSQDDHKIKIRFEVKDTGIGMTEEDQQKLFSPFSQADASITRRFGGTGLGLSICKRLVNLMGGHISLVSQLGEGTQFSFVLEFERAQHVPTEDHERDFDYKTIRFLNSKILLAEDNEVNQHLFKEIFGSAGIEVEVVDNGLEAVRYIEAGGQADLIAMDLHMPQMDGYEASKIISKRVETPIIAISADALVGIKEKVMNAGMKDIVTKPIELQKLFSVLLKWLPKEKILMDDAMLSLDQDEPMTLERRLQQAFPEFEILDALKRMGGNWTLYKAVMNQLPVSFAKCKQDIQTAKAASDMIELRANAHLLKGLSATVGASDLNEIAAEINDQPIEEMMTLSVEEIVAPLLRELDFAEKIVNQINEWIVLEDYRA